MVGGRDRILPSDPTTAVPGGTLMRSERFAGPKTEQVIYNSMYITSNIMTPNRNDGDEVAVRAARPAVSDLQVSPSAIVPNRGTAT